MQTRAKRHPRYWRTHADDSSKCELYVEEGVAYKGTMACCFVHENVSKTSQGYMVQTMGAAEFRSKRLRLSGKIKVLQLKGLASLYVQILDCSPNLVLEDKMLGHELTEVHDWTELNVVLDVPEEARYINFGAIITGSGRILVSDLCMEEVTKDVELTDVGSIEGLPHNPVNFELESASKESLSGIPGWRFVTRPDSDASPFKCEVKTVDERKALWISSLSEPVPEQGERSNTDATFSQKFRCNQWRTKRVAFSADIKCIGVEDWCGLMMWVTGINGKVLGFTTMYDAEFGGISDWKRWSMVLDVPAIACQVIVAATLHGNGEVFFANLSFDAVDVATPTTDRQTRTKNLGFID